MSAKANRFTQHREERESKKTAKHLKHLKGEKQKLAKENARLRKQLEKATAIRDQFVGEQEDRSERAKAVLSITVVCSKCDSENVVLINLIGRDYRVCKDCKHRERVAAA